MLSNFHKTTSERWRSTPGTQKGSPFSSKGGRTKYKRQDKYYTNINKRLELQRLWYLTGPWNQPLWTLRDDCINHSVDEVMGIRQSLVWLMDLSTVVTILEINLTVPRRISKAYALSFDRFPARVYNIFYSPQCSKNVLFFLRAESPWAKELSAYSVKFLEEAGTYLVFSNFMESMNKTINFCIALFE